MRHGVSLRRKNTLDRNYLAVAEDCADDENQRFVTIRTLCEALTISPAASGNGYEVAYCDHLLGTQQMVSAEHVFLCGGSVNTTELLLRSFISTNSAAEAKAIRRWARA